MEPVVTVNLNGNAYQLDQSAYETLKVYLNAAGAALASNADKAEILADLEQAIADKCTAFLSAHKTIVSAAEMKRALDEMGPVEGDGGAEAHEAEQPSAQPGGAKRRIYRIRDDAKIAGVCTGIGAYFDLDVNWIRLLFLAAAALTSGAFVLVYVAMMFIIPSAHTSQEWAAAHGVPFNAQDVIDKAKRQYAEFAANGPPWRGPRGWRRQQRRAWTRAVKERVYSWSGGGDIPPTPAHDGPSQALADVVSLMLAFARLGLGIIFALAALSLIATGALGYYHLPANVSLWQALLVLFVIYALMSVGLRALHWAAYGVAGGRAYYYRPHRSDGFLSMIIFAVLAWLIYQHVPEAHAWIDQARLVIDRVFERLVEAARER